MGKNPRILKTDFNDGVKYKELWDTIISGQSWHGVFLNRKKSGELYWESATISPVKDERGKTTHFLAVKEDITERKYAESELQRAQEKLETAHRELQQSFVREQQLSRTDDLTGINNHRYLMELARHEFDVAMRYHQPLSVMFFDIDHFKKVNDTFGHAIGDQGLNLTIQSVCSSLRSTDLIGRYGGDEFVILLPHTNAEDSLHLAVRIHEGLANSWLETDKGRLNLTISIGISQSIHTAPDTIEDLLLRADRALYTAKQTGRHRSEIYKSDTIGAI